MKEDKEAILAAARMGSLPAMAAVLHDFNTARAWQPYHSPRNLAMALSVEAAELLELYLWSEDQGPQPALPSRAAQVADEAADVLICLLNLCAAADIDLGAAFCAKVEKNAAKYPVDRAYGSARKHDEL